MESNVDAKVPYASASSISSETANTCGEFVGGVVAAPASFF